MVKYSVDVLSYAACIIGESPVYDADSHSFLFIDVYGQYIREITCNDMKTSDTVLPQKVGTLVLSDDGKRVVALEDGIYSLDNGYLCPLAVPKHIEGLRFNDGKPGPDGRLYVGTYSKNFTAAFYRMDNNGSLNRLFGGVGNSNGLAWSMDCKILYYIDTPTRRLDAFLFDKSEGTVSNRKTVYTFSKKDGMPDGMTIDIEGRLWIALWGTSRVVCIDPYDSMIIDEIRLPVSKVTSCAFGGSDYSDLIITTAAYQTDLHEEPLAGSTFIVHTQTYATPAYKLTHNADPHL